MITLKDFIKEALTQIVDANTEFNAEKSGTGANTNPMVYAYGEAMASQGFFRTPDGQNIVTINFDVAISAEEGERSGGSGGIKVLSVFSAEGGMEQATTNTSVSRVRFPIPLRLPGKVQD